MSELSLRRYAKITTLDVWEFCDRESDRMDLDKEQFSGELCELRRQAQRETLNRLCDHLADLDEKSTDR